MRNTQQTDTKEGFLQVITTIDSEQQAKVIARLVIEHRLAACVQVYGPVSSIYRWKGQVEEAQEWACAIKTTAAHYAGLERLIKGHHPYEVPEILALPVQEGNAAYLDWLRAECADETKP